MKAISNFGILLMSVIFQKIIGQEINLEFLQHDYKLKCERGEVIYCNKDFFRECSCKTFKYNRSIAVMNATITPIVNLGEEVEIIIQVYKFMSNEYRFYPIHFEANACKSFKADVMGIQGGFERCGNIELCKLLKGITYYVCNWYPDSSKLPPLIPNGQFKVEMKLLHFTQEIVVVNLYGTVFRAIV